MKQKIWCWSKTTTGKTLLMLPNKCPLFPLNLRPPSYWGPRMRTVKLRSARQKAQTRPKPSQLTKLSQLEQRGPTKKPSKAKKTKHLELLLKNQGRVRLEIKQAIWTQSNHFNIQDSYRQTPHPMSALQPKSSSQSNTKLYKKHRSVYLNLIIPDHLDKEFFVNANA